MKCKYTCKQSETRKSEANSMGVCERDAGKATTVKMTNEADDQKEKKETD